MRKTIRAIRKMLDEYEIELESGSLDLYHGTVQPVGQIITRFRTGRAMPMPRASSARYNFPGESIQALTEIDAVWFATNPAIADSYIQPRWGQSLSDGQEGQFYEVVVTASRIAYVPYTEEDSVRAALTANPQVIVLEDREEALVLNPNLIEIISVTNAEGDVID